MRHAREQAPKAGTASRVTAHESANETEKMVKHVSDSFVHGICPSPAG